MKHRLNPTAAALLAAFALPAALPQAAFAQAVATTLPEVKVEARVDQDFAPERSTVGAKAPLALRDIAQSVTVINRAVLESQAATSMVEALRNVPGITISAGEGGQIGDNINLRGFSARTDMFIDGFRDRGQYARDTFFLDAVEVLKGPSSMLFGRGSTGGVINQVSKKPGLKASSEASASIGTDDYYRATIDLNRPLSDTSALRISAMASDIGSTRDVSKAKHMGVAPSLRLGIGTPTEITLSALIQRNRDLPDYGMPLLGTGPGTVAKPIDAPSERFYGFTDDKNDQDVDVLTASVRHKFGPNVTVSNRTQFSQTETTASPTPLGAVVMVAPNPGPPSRNTPLNQLKAPYSTRDRVANDKTLFNQTDLIVKAVTGTIKHTITAGAELGRDKFSNDVYTWAGLGDANLGVSDYGPKPASATRTPGAVTDTTADTLAVYLNDQLELNKQWKLVGGLRWDRFSSDFSSKTTPAAAAVLRSRTDKMLSTRLGAIWQPSETQSYYVSYGTSFNPSAEAMSLSATTEGLTPEKNRSLEAGAKLDLLDGSLTFNTAVFRVEKTDARTTDPLSGLVNLDGNIRVQGVELGVVGRITPAWQVLAGYTWLDGQVVSSRDRSGAGTAASPYLYAQGKTLANTPEHSASLWSTYSFGGNWEAGGGVVYSSDRYVNNFESAQIDGYTRFDATLAYKQKNYDLRLNLQNVGDKRYFETASAGRATPAKGRTIIASVNYRF
ncbi:MAG: TonB-dependent siderophore receptor [Pseudomonadota bacterium]